MKIIVRTAAKMDEELITVKNIATSTSQHLRRCFHLVKEMEKKDLQTLYKEKGVENDLSNLQLHIQEAFNIVEKFT